MRNRVYSYSDNPSRCSAVRRHYSQSSLCCSILCKIYPVTTLSKYLPYYGTMSQPLCPSPLSTTTSQAPIAHILYRANSIAATAPTTPPVRISAAESSSSSLLLSEEAVSLVSSEEAEVVLDALHWGESGTSTPLPEQMSLAKEMASERPESSHASSRQHEMPLMKSLLPQMHLMSRGPQSAIFPEPTYSLTQSCCI